MLGLAKDLNRVLKSWSACQATPAPDGSNQYDPQKAGSGREQERELHQVSPLVSNIVKIQRRTRTMIRRIRGRHRNETERNIQTGSSDSTVLDEGQSGG